MTTLWYVHRRDDGTIASAHEELQEGYAEEALEADYADVVAFFAKAYPPPPIVVSRLRLKLELASRSQLAAVESAVAAAGGNAPLYWAEAKDFESNHPLVAQIGAAIGLDAAGIRALFKAAAAAEI